MALQGSSPTWSIHLSCENVPLPVSLPFDTTGNRNLAGGTSSSASGTFNRVQNDGTYTYDYDAEGNQIRRTHGGTGAVTEYEYDYRNRLVKVTDRASVGGAATQIVEYQYDAFDRRTGKELDSDADGVVERREAWAWGADQVLLQLVDADGDGAGSWKLADRYLHGAVLDMVLADEQLPGGGITLNSVSSTAGTVLWPLGDQLGSVRDLVDSNGVIREHVVYDSFGRQLSETDFDSAGTPIASNSPLAVDTLFGFTGREWDADTELQYNRARWYDPGQGRWLNQDPIGFSAGDVNLYRYVGNGVTGATDPIGLAKVTRWYKGLKLLVDKDTAELVLKNGRRIRIRNAKFIGCAVSLDDIHELTDVSKATIKKLRRDYPNGLTIRFNRFGQPDFSKVKKAAVKITNPGASNYRDQAWKELRKKHPELYKKFWRRRRDFIWHHAADGSLQLVDKNVHTAFQHTGLNSVLRKLGGTACMLIPGAQAFSEGRLNDAGRELAVEASPLAFSMLISDALSAFYDWVWDDLYGEAAKKRHEKEGDGFKF